MNFHKTTYTRSMRSDCIELMLDTWNLDAHFPELKKKNLINSLFFDSAIIGMTHRDVIVDDHGKVHGYLFGHVGESPKNYWQLITESTILFFRAAWHYLWGNFGSRRRAGKWLEEIESMEEKLLSKRQTNDAYVGLFFVSSKLRGSGMGKQLMTDFEKMGRAKGAERLYLWTDKSCNYGFYDHIGFKRAVEIASPLLAEYSDEPNGFAYQKSI